MENRVGMQSRGPLLLMLSNIAFTGMVCLLRFTEDTSAFTAVVIRFGIGLAVIGALVLAGRATLTCHNKRALLLRGLLGGAAIFMGFEAILHIGIVKASILINTYPLFATLFGALLLGEAIGIRKGLLALLAFAGLTLVVTDGHPQAIMTGFGFWELFAVAGAILGGFAFTLVKQLAGKESTATIFMAQCLAGFWMFVGPAISSPVSIDAPVALALLGIGLLAAVGQLTLTEGMRHVTVSTSAMFTMTGPVMTCIAGALFFHESITVATIGGSALVFSACGAMLFIRRPHATEPVLSSSLTAIAAKS